MRAPMNPAGGRSVRADDITSKVSPRLAGLLTAAAVAASLLALPAGAEAARDLHVERGGKDSWPGTAKRPFRTVGRALEVTRGGETVWVGPGRYPPIKYRGMRRRYVTVRGRRSASGALPRIYGMQITGGNRLRLKGLSFVGTVYISEHPVLKSKRLSHHIQVTDSEFTNYRPFTEVCVFIRSGSHHVRLARNVIHRCRTAIGGPGDGIRDPSRRVRSRAISIVDNWIGPVREDGLQIGHWEDVTIARNVIREQHDPAYRLHTDGIQVTGDVHRLRIADNVISHGGQLVFVQGALGANSAVRISGNLVYESTNYAIKVSAIDGLDIVGNTVWRTKYGGLIVRQDVQRASILGNVLDAIAFDRSRAERRAGNVILRSRGTPGPGDSVGAEPAFADAAADDFRLHNGSPGARHAEQGWTAGCVLRGFPPRVPRARAATALEPACGVAGG